MTLKIVLIFFALGTLSMSYKFAPMLFDELKENSLNCLKDLNVSTVIHIAFELPQVILPYFAVNYQKTSGNFTNEVLFMYGPKMNQVNESLATVQKFIAPAKPFF